MNAETFYQTVKDDLDKLLALMKAKGAAYSGAEDVLDNFKRNAKRVGVSPFQIWLVYFNKHIDAITNAIKNNPGYPVEPTESMEGRINDAINYLFLLKGLLVDEDPAQ
jgi:hypothetical protein